MPKTQNRAMTLDDLFPGGAETPTATIEVANPPQEMDSLDAEQVAPEVAPEVQLGRDKMNSAILALGRRVVARPGPDLLMHDALELLLDTFALDCGLVAEHATAGGGLVVRAVAVTHGAKPELGQILGERSLAGQAFATGQLQFSTNLATELQSENSTLRNLGMASAIAAPLRLVGENIGALVVGSTEVRHFTGPEIAGVEAVSLLLMSALAYYRADERRERQADFSQALQQTTTLPVVVLDAQGKIVEVNRRCLEVSAFRERDLTDRPFCEALCIPAEGAEVQAKLAQVKLAQASAGNARIQFESQLLGKDAAQHAIVWSVCPTRHPKTSGPCLLLMGTLAGQSNQAGVATGDAPSAAAEPGPEQQGPTAREAEQLQAALAERNKNLRSSQRKTFPFYQPLAPYRGQNPAEGEFFMARFRDISAGGLSFVSTQKPTYPAIMVKLGTPAEPKKMIAKIVRAVPIVEDGKPAFLIGCTFVSRA